MKARLHMGGQLPDMDHETNSLLAEFQRIGFSYSEGTSRRINTEGCGSRRHLIILFLHSRIIATCFSQIFLNMSTTRSSTEAILAKGNTLLEHHLGMVKMGMPPSDVNPKLLEAAQTTVCPFSRRSVVYQFLTKLPVS
jgi:hypothetical protein